MNSAVRVWPTTICSWRIRPRSRANRRRRVSRAIPGQREERGRKQRPRALRRGCAERRSSRRTQPPDKTPTRRPGSRCTPWSCVIRIRPSRRPSKSVKRGGRAGCAVWKRPRPSANRYGREQQLGQHVVADLRDGRQVLGQERDDGRGPSADGGRRRAVRRARCHTRTARCPRRAGRRAGAARSGCRRSARRPARRARSRAAAGATRSGSA